MKSVCMVDVYTICMSMLFLYWPSIYKKIKTINMFFSEYQNLLATSPEQCGRAFWVRFAVARTLLFLATGKDTLPPGTQTVGVLKARSPLNKFPTVLYTPETWSERNHTPYYNSKIDSYVGILEYQKHELRVQKLFPFSDSCPL
jgi:hypothetical protein